MSRPTVLVLAACLAGAGCARSGVAGPTPAASLCAVGDTALVRDLVYFGRNRPDGGTVSDAEWLGFLDSVVTPSFPNGFTVVEGTGQWKGQSGAVERERSAIITFLHTGSAADRDRVAQVAGEYKRRFHQEAVLRERSPACARFE